MPWFTGIIDVSLFIYIDNNITDIINLSGMPNITIFCISNLLTFINIENGS